MERGFLSSGRKGGKQRKNASNNVASDDAKDSGNEELDTSLSRLKNSVVNVDGVGNSYVTPGIDVESVIIGDEKLNGGNTKSNMHDESGGIDPALMKVSNALDNEVNIHGNEKRNSIGNTPSPILFYSQVKGDSSRKAVNFFLLLRWLGKFGLVKSMMIKDILFFKFGSKDGMDAMLENGPWLIRNVPLILKQWTPNTNVIKEDVCNIPVWVKFHDVPITVFIEDRLSAIATKLGKPLMFDSYMVTMCTDSLGRASYARAMIELKADVELRDTIVVVVPKFSGEGFITSTIRVEYEWAPSRCFECKIFRHVLDDCPKKIISDISKNSKMPRQRARGPPVGLKPKSTFVYRLISTKKAAKANRNLIRCNQVSHTGSSLKFTCRKHLPSHLDISTDFRLSSHTSLHSNQFL
ncbi:hypothetical protein Tco_0588181 [Tanacetum coccineum]